MSDNHVNVYLMDVQEKQAALEVAKGNLDAAQATLKAHPDYVAPESEAPKKKPSPKK